MWAWYLLVAYTVAYTGGAFAVTTAAGVGGFGANPYLRAVFAGALGIGVTTLFILYLVGGNVRFPKRDFALSMLLVYLALLSGAIGLLRDNPLVYVVADVAFILVGVAGYLLTRMGRVIVAIDKMSVKRVVLFGWVLVSLTFIGAIATSASLSLILVAVFASCLFAGELRSSVATFLPLLVLIPLFNRATVLTIAVVIAITTAVTVGKGRLRATLKTLSLLAVFSAVLWVGLSFISDTPWFSQSALGFRIQKTQSVFVGEGVDTSEDPAVERRLSELELATDNLGTNPLNWVFGMGAGATIDLSSLGIGEANNASLTGERDVHTLHLLPMTILYRHGLLGLLLLAALVLWLIQTAFTAGERTTFTAAIAALALIIYSIPASSYVFREPLMWFSLAWMVNSASLQYSIQEWRRSTHRSPPLNTSHMLVSNQAQRSEAVRRVRQQ